MAKIKTALMALLMASVLGIAACGGDDDGDDGGTTAGADNTQTSVAGGPEKIVIKTRLAPVNARGETTGEVLSGSTIGDSAFCAGGEFIDGAQTPGDSSISRSFRCPDGTLTITFNSTPPDVKQRSAWKVVKGLRSYEGLSGGGQMTGVSESSNGAARESFTGTVTR